MNTEIVYIGRDNTISRMLMADHEPLTNAQMESISKIVLKIGTITITVLQADRSTGVIRWLASGFRQAEVKFILGDYAGMSALAGTTRRAWITVYDAINNDGLVWGYFNVRVSAAP